ncbi:MAG TPA: universal stress protein [Stellaceae bacterium]|nr:universal stress protein [Stellaceae bacterium]
MPYDILIAIDNPDTIPGCMAPAAAVARRLEAPVTGLYVTGVPAPSAYGDVTGWQQMIDAYMEAQRLAATQAEMAFRQELARFQLAGDWLYRESDMTNGIADVARVYDLLILGQATPQAESDRLAALRPEDIVLDCGRPVLLVPFAGEFDEVGRRVLIAWNGSREATRALHDALPLLAGAEAVTVIEVDRVASDAGEAALGAGEVAEFLNRRGLPARSEAAASGDVSVPDLLLSRAADLGADLVVMGSYGRSRLSEAVLGGVSRSIFQTMTVPVLMSH